MNSRERVAEILRQVKSLPTLPDVAAQVLAIDEQSAASTGDIAGTVERDLSMATRVLKLVNSAFFGVRREVTSVQQALLLMGTAKLRKLVLSGAMFDLFDHVGSVGKFRRVDLWRHSMATAVGGREIAQRTKAADPDLAFTAGLIHDVGKVIIDRFLHDDFVRIVQRIEETNAAMSEAEMDVLGVEHGQIGQHLAIRWNLPAVLQEAVGYHHAPLEAPTEARIAAMIAIANHLAGELGYRAFGGSMQTPGDEIRELAGLRTDDEQLVRRKLADSLEEQVGLLTDRRDVNSAAAAT